MLTAGRPKTKPNGVDEIALTDKDIEHSQALVILLDLLYGLPVTRPTDDDREWINIENTIHLARKYDCSGALQALHHAIRGWLLKLEEPRRLFLLAAMFDDIEACSMIIKLAGRMQCPPEPRSALEFRPSATAKSALAQRIPGGHAFDVATWAPSLARRLPFRYMFALMRAEYEARHPAQGVAGWRSWKAITAQVDWEAVSVRFRQLLEEDKTTEKAMPASPSFTARVHGKSKRRYMYTVLAVPYLALG
jgi:hypothetical protein